MELPEDVLAIIRAYAKPCFKYFREYNNLLKILGKSDWPRLKDKLESHPEHVLPALLAYQMAVLINKNLFKEMFTLGNSSSLTYSRQGQNRFYNMNFYTKKEVEDTFRVLIRLLHPEQRDWELNSI